MRSYNSFLTANNASQIISIYKDFIKNPSSVDQSWHNFFKELAPEELAILADYEKLDWSKKTRSRDFSQTSLNEAIADSLKLVMMIRAYREIGHLIADLDPLGLDTKSKPAGLDPEYYGFQEKDLDRKIVYVTTGNAGRFYDGTNRPGDNKYSNSLLAIDIKNKKLLWEFQEIQHDIWNYDIASPPILTSIKVKGKNVDVVVAPTKFGNTLVLDRLSGNSIFSYKKKKVPLSNVPGEKTSFYQKVFELPEPFSNQYFKSTDITDISEERHEFVKEKIRDATFGFFIPNSIDKKNIIYKGGAQWMGASIDNRKGIMYVPSNDVPNFIWLEKNIGNNFFYEYSMNWEFINDQFGHPGSKPPWGSITAINLK